MELAGSVAKKTTIMLQSNTTTYADCIATICCFHKKQAFPAEILVACKNWTVMLADNSSVEVNYWADVIVSFPHPDISLGQEFFRSLLRFK